MAKCGECKQTAGDVVASATEAVATAVTTSGRWIVRGACHWFSDEQMSHGRVQLRWRLSIEAAAAAGLTWWLGRPAAFVFAGMFAVSWVLAHGAAVELERRALRRQLTQPRQPGAEARPSGAVADPDIDAEAEAMMAAYKAGEAGR